LKNPNNPVGFLKTQQNPKNPIVVVVVVVVVVMILILIVVVVVTATALKKINNPSQVLKWLKTYL